eukprot:CAMPEP_0184293102 /NCGR_PEP_ID=MMETSP1049-20130417/4672_1 /TAXON_ID=77928 /ORGANISM="Proteomonas sulcata, Strain CCMP704" /LENGTH=57 /DNA_ID=CAMNT_0026601033 /DNA_START=73 /DNA_END=243 /DNA_ORIENTATION=-
MFSTLRNFQTLFHDKPLEGMYFSGPPPDEPNPWPAGASGKGNGWASECTAKQTDEAW